MERRLSLRRADISLKNFNNVAFPHLIDLLQKHKDNIRKFRATENLERVKNEQINATRIIIQLRNLLEEMDLLRQQIIEKDLEKFDQMTEKSRNITDQAIQEYMAMTYKDESTNCSSFSSGYSSHSSAMCNDASHREESSSSKNNDFVNLIANDFQLLENDMQQKEDCLKSWEALQEEVHDLHELFVKFEEVIKVQAEPVNIVEQNIEATSENVIGGLAFLRKAERFKTAWYPLAGAVIGGCFAGPIGLVTGLKIGSLAILSGTAMGFTGGKILKNKKESDFHITNDIQELPSDNMKKNS